MFTCLLSIEDNTEINDDTLSNCCDDDEGGDFIIPIPVVSRGEVFVPVPLFDVEVDPFLDPESLCLLLGVNSPLSSAS